MTPICPSFCVQIKKVLLCLKVSTTSNVGASPEKKSMAADTGDGRIICHGTMCVGKAGNSSPCRKAFFLLHEHGLLAQYKGPNPAATGQPPERAGQVLFMLTPVRKLGIRQLTPCEILIGTSAEQEPWLVQLTRPEEYFKWINGLWGVSAGHLVGKGGAGAAEAVLLYCNNTGKQAAHTRTAASGRVRPVGDASIVLRRSKGRVACFSPPMRPGRRLNVEALEPDSPVSGKCVHFAGGTSEYKSEQQPWEDEEIKQLWYSRSDFERMRVQSYRRFDIARARFSEWCRRTLVWRKRRPIQVSVIG